MSQPLIGIHGAGSIGCYVGGRLRASGAQVHFVTRPAMASELGRSGLRLTDYRGAECVVPPAELSVGCDAAGLRDADLVLVTVKSAATEQAARELAPVLKPGAIVLSLQNGLHNADVLARALSGHAVLAGLVQFNVVKRGPGAFHQGSAGGLDAEHLYALEPYLARFERAGVGLRLHANFEAVQWAKLLLNLNNPINALSDLPLQQEIGQRAFRACLALAQREALEVLRAAGKRPARLTKLPPAWMARLLTVPDVLYAAFGQQALAIDPLARSSMWDDLQAGRVTEVEYINGEVVALAEKLGRQAPVNARLVALMREAEAGGRRGWQGARLLRELRHARAAEK